MPVNPIYKKAIWQRVRRFVLDRDGWRCRKCGRAGALEVHHVKPLQDGGEPYDPANLQTLCRTCHTDTHRPHVRGQQEWKELLHAIA